MHCPRPSTRGRSWHETTTPSYLGTPYCKRELTGFDFCEQPCPPALPSGSDLEHLRYAHLRRIIDLTMRILKASCSVTLQYYLSQLTPSTDTRSKTFSFTVCTTFLLIRVHILFYQKQANLPLKTYFIQEYLERRPTNITGTPLPV